MEAHRNAVNRIAARVALEAAGDLDVGRTEMLQAAIEWLDGTPARSVDQTSLRRRTGLTAGQLRALMRLGRDGDPTNKAPGAPTACILEAHERREATRGDPPANAEGERGKEATEGSPAAARSRGTARKVARAGENALLLFVAGSVLLFFLFFAIADMPGSGTAAPESVPQTRRWESPPEDTSRITEVEPRRDVAPRRTGRMLLPTDEEVIQDLKEELGCLLPKGAPDRWKAARRESPTWSIARPP